MNEYKGGFSMVIYLSTHRRRPVWVGRGSSSPDAQEALPRWWCSRCGREIYGKGRELCRRCAGEKGGRWI